MIYRSTSSDTTSRQKINFLHVFHPHVYVHRLSNELNDLFIVLFIRVLHKVHEISAAHRTRLMILRLPLCFISDREKSIWITLQLGFYTKRRWTSSLLMS
jgi:hypothetical protein